MKTSSSNRGRSSTQNTQLRDQQSTKPATPLQNRNANNINIIGKKTQSKKLLPPKIQQKNEYNVEVNMTQSKIFEAKKGLQLLKRKMNRTGMSRQKNYSSTDKNLENVPPFTKIISKEALNVQTINIPKQPSIVQKKSKLLQKTVNSFNKEERNLESIKERQFFQGENFKQFQDERPISNNTNFMDLLQRQIKKQIKNNKRIEPSYPNKIFNEKGNQIILHQCSKGCKRMFNPQTIDKHEKICRKVFQSKRKAFNSAQYRHIQAEGYKNEPNIVKKQTKLQKKQNEIPKWKLESIAFRAGIKLSQNKQLSKQQQKFMQLAQQGLKCCTFCGRKFNEKAAQKHIPFCEKKSKQISNKSRKK